MLFNKNKYPDKEIKKLKEFADHGLSKDHRELKMAYEQVYKSLKELDTWLVIIKGIEEKIEKKAKK